MPQGIFHSVKQAISQTNPVRLLWHKSKAFIAALLNGFPARGLTVIAITGTDGKTTTVGMIAHILTENGMKTGALSTAFFQIGNAVTWNATQKTSPSPFTIQKFLRTCKAAHCTHVVLEASSHGLLQGRMNFTWPRVAAITNISEEHLDYHGTMERYIAAKGLLFRKIQKGGTKVLNRDDRSFDLLRNIPTAHTVEYSPSHDVPPDLRLRIPGDFNKANALCAMRCSEALGIPPQASIQALASFKGIPGRMEEISEGQPFRVFVDFTVTPAAYERTLSALKKELAPGKRLLVLTGSCGDRMREKRPVVGKIVSTFADVMVVANEDPYTEDPEKIIDDVWRGIDTSKTEAHRIFDRHKAIEFLLSEAKSEDIVILCGKGSDVTMMLASGQIPWNEREIVREILQQRKHG